jgi:asparagine synthetase B (glutamine-hydrolysing)
VALWSAASGRGALHCGGTLSSGGSGSSSGAPMISTARVLISGLGADEQCVGYKGRHRTKFLTGGWDLLAAEVRKDIGRIWCVTFRSSWPMPTGGGHCMGGV